MFDAFDRWLNHKIESLRPTFVFAEDQFMPRNIAVAQRLYGMRAICVMACHRHDIRLRWVPVQSLQRFFTGHGRWPKGQKKSATIRVCNLYGWRPDTDNEADALAVWLWGEHNVSPIAARARGAGTLFA